MDIAVKSKTTNKELDVETIRKDFPILQTKVHGQPLIYFDNAATSKNHWWFSMLFRNIIKRRTAMYIGAFTT